MVPDPPRDIETNKLFRAWLLQAVRPSKRRREAVLERCQNDILFWINSFVWQYNTMALGAHAYSREAGPFVTWGFQDRAIRKIGECIRNRRDLIILKSREMGASWLCLLVQAHPFLFGKWQDFITISLNEKAVEQSGDPQCLFYKLDFIFERLPNWMLEGRYDPWDGKKTCRKDLRFLNPKRHNSITGQASTARAGVGGRARAMFIDEYSAIEDDYGVLHYTANTTGCRIFNGTHRGLGTAFYELSQRVDIERLVMHWSEHPDKARGLYTFKDGKIEQIDKTYHFGDFHFVHEETPAGGPFPGIRSPWYDEMVPRQGSSRAVAMNLDIDPKGSTSQFFDALVIHNLKKEFCCEPYWEGDLRYDQDTGRPFRLEKRAGGLLRLWLHPTAEGKIPPDIYGMGGDLAIGTGATNSCFCVVRSTGDKVAEYADPYLSPDRAAAFAVALCWLFKSSSGEGAKFCWEQQGPGITFGNRVVELGYRNVYYRRGEDTISKTADPDKPGWCPNVGSNKRSVLEEYRDALTARQFINRSEIALTECLDFEYTDRGGVEHGGALAAEDPTKARENHGDRVIADALAWKMVKSFGKKPVEKKVERFPEMSLGWRRMQWEEAQKDGWE